LRLPIYGEAGFNEAVGLDMVRAVGEPAQRWAYSSVRINGAPAALRLLVEVPTAAFAAREFGSQGVLYRATGDSVFDYLGDDPAAYESSFEQISPAGPVDLSPVIDLVRWTSQASDAEFATGLADRVDVDSLAEYLAVHVAINNWDDMGGGGRNYYLWLDDESGRFTVVSWDVNLAFYRDLFRRREQDEIDARPAPAPVVNSEGVLVVDLVPDVTADPPSNNALKSRFLETPAFASLFEQALVRDCATLIDAGAAAASFQHAVRTVLESGVLDAEVIHDEVETMRAALEYKSQQCDLGTNEPQR